MVSQSVVGMASSGPSVAVPPPARLSTLKNAQINLVALREDAWYELEGILAEVGQGPSSSLSIYTYLCVLVSVSPSSNDSLVLVLHVIHFPLWR